MIQRKMQFSSALSTGPLYTFPFVVKCRRATPKKVFSFGAQHHASRASQALQPSYVFVCVC